MSDPLGALGLSQVEKHEHRERVPESLDYTENVNRYNAWWPFPDGATGPEADEARKKREQNANQVAIDYYDLVSPSYEQGWGLSFHYGPMTPGLSIKDSLKAYEISSGEVTGLKKGMKVLDVGCGVGGPARTMAKTFGCCIVGLTNCLWHVERGTQLNKDDSLEQLVEILHGDFNHMPFEDNSFDAAYAFEAICYAPDLTLVFNELRRVLKPGAPFGLHDWVMTDKFDPSNDKHCITRDQIERGNGLVKMPLISEYRDGLKQCGFNIMHEENMELRSKPGPWYYPILGKLRYATCKADFLTTLMMERRVVVPMIDVLYWFLTKFKVVPNDFITAFNIMKMCTMSVAKGSQEGIFSPMWRIISKNEKAQE